MNCIHCKQEINPLRLKALPNTKTCVNCSTASPKKGITTMFGEKDHTWNDIIFVDENQYKNYIDNTPTTDLNEDDNEINEI
jgi:RNA polymerase-binding transcription factor DksA